MAARRGDESWLWGDGVPFAAAHDALVALVSAEDVLVGHNLHRFDRVKLAERFPASPLLGLPTLDTLELSVLAFPQRPYHALVKDERLVRDEVPNPASDVRASQRLLDDARERLRALPLAEQLLLAALIEAVDLPPSARAGWSAFFADVGWPRAQPLTRATLATAWAGKVCQRSPALEPWRRDLTQVFVAAWLQTGEGGEVSVLPAWVRRSHPFTARMVRSLRATTCDDPTCAWCRTQRTPEHWLQQVFGFDAFRAEPATASGESLQRLLVQRGLDGVATFGILPTGGGKSLCFQVPAEARYRLLGQLTVVISPLRSLMKDQVDNLADRIPHAQALYGGLPSLLRPEVIRRVREGACGLLYLSPEQFRNRSVVKLLAQRELGAIVFDEAHCLSQWGHDFRTDYPYVLRAVRKLTGAQGAPMPPIYLFTATTQADATQQILKHVTDESGHVPELLDGGSRRDNLEYIVREVPEASRLEAAVDLLEEHLGTGTAILFCGSRKRTEDVADRLSGFGYPAVAYHAGLADDERRELQTAFIDGAHRVIVATNAFGMGVDKDNVRLVVHMDMPSSLESYLQEAGRAGRDREPAVAVLFWAPGDAEARFRLGGQSDLSPEDLRALWRAIRALPASRVAGTPLRERRVATARELLMMEAVGGRFEPQVHGEETRVKAAVNWLERAKVLERTENETRVFTGRPKAASLAASLATLDGLTLPEHKAEQWRKVLECLWAARDDGLDADAIAELTREMSPDKPLDGGLRVLDILAQMVEARLIEPGQTFSAVLQRGRNASRPRFERWCQREQALLKALGEAEDARADGLHVHLDAIGKRLSEERHACSSREAGRLLRAWTTLGQGITREVVAPTFQQRGADLGVLSLNAPLPDLARLVRTRQAVASVALSYLEGLVEAGNGNALVSSELERVVAAVEQDLTLRAALSDAVEATRAAVWWLHEVDVLNVQSGLAVFRSAMCMERDEAAPGLGDGGARDVLRELRQHQEQRVLRVHVMDEWCRLMTTEPDSAEELREDWFALPVSDFVARWFARRKSEVARPTTGQSFASIVTDLNDDAQASVVTRDPRRNQLVLAGPGSGKTRILVHRVAWLLRVQRARASQILVVCYTRANALELGRRLRQLVGDDARGVTIRTLHGVALGLVGAHRLQPQGDLSLDDAIVEATRLLQGEGLDDGERSAQREGLLRGFGYIFVDEYQDIDEAKYALLDALIGRSRSEDERRLRVFAVGDDDQAIFAYEGAKTRFLREFEASYNAVRTVVRTNYRNPRGVLELAQAVVAPIPDRLKADHTLQVNDARAQDPPMGPWAAARRDLQGHIVWRQSSSVRAAAASLMEVVRGWIDDGVPPTRIGVLTRTRTGGLNRLRIAAEALQLPFSWPLPSDASLPLARVREVVRLRRFLDGLDQLTRGEAIDRELEAMGTGPWVRSLRTWLEPNLDRHRRPEAWRADLAEWLRLERRARTLGEGVHLGTIHSAKGLEFDHVLLLDEGQQQVDDDERRLLYVALTRARLSLQLFSTDEPSPLWRTLRHPLLDVRQQPLLAHDGHADHSYDLLGRADVWIDWLGGRSAAERAHAVLDHAPSGAPFRLHDAGQRVEVRDGEDVVVAMLSAKGAERWRPRMQGGTLRLKLVAATREYAADDWREQSFRERLRVPEWWTGVWEGRWREG